MRKLSYVLVGIAPFIKVIGKDGRLLREMGRMGSGPGEFRQPIRLGWVRDTLWVSDPGLRRITFFPRGLPPGSTIDEPSKAPPPFAGTTLLGMLSDGNVLLGSSTNEPQGLRSVGLPSVIQVGVFLATRQGAVTRHLAFYQQQNSTVRVRAMVNGMIGSFYVYQPFRNDPIVEVSSEGSALAIVLRGAQEDRRSFFSVTKVGPRGDTIFSRRIQYRPRELDGATYAAALRRLAHPTLRSGKTASIDEEELRAAILRPKTLPPVEEVMLSKDGRTWLRRETTDGSSSVEYLVLGPGGLPEATVVVPSRERVVESDGATVWTTGKGTDDVPTVTIYQVVPRKSSK